MRVTRTLWLTSCAVAVCACACLGAVAKQAGATAQQRQRGYETHIRWTGTLQAADAAIVTRAGFWQGIRATPDPDDFSDYYNHGPWGYSNLVGPWGNYTAPHPVPDNL